ncbi:MAG: hypothetical protein K9K66_04325 [Desulfarculaceae bacterium]|nr:hypothetical protein [Desulfarculaceae bacterium]MCF8073269.1 hypothetical protein [Desulfarculaceae bacterium]MCF8100865.1 hypothetical protein [Desulfarculaceae bacterium]
MLNADGLQACQVRRRLLASVKAIEELAPAGMRSLLECVGCPGPVALPESLPPERLPMEPGQVIFFERSTREWQMKNVLSVADIANGAAIKTFDRELAAMAENIMDPNTEAKAMRKVVLEVAIKPDKDRDVGLLTYKVKSTLAPPKPEEKRVFVFVKNGKAVMAMGNRTPLFDEQEQGGDQGEDAEENPKKGPIGAVN